MNISYERNGGVLTVFLCGELDHHAAKKVIPNVLSLIDIELPTAVVLDFSSVNFMDSSGIALIIGTFKRSRSVDGSFKVINVSRQAYKVLEAASICKIVDVSCKEAVCASNIRNEG